MTRFVMGKRQSPLHDGSTPPRHSIGFPSFAGAVKLTKHLLAGSLVLTLLLCGCARTYVITLTNGARVTSKGKPKLQKGVYVFKDVKGQPAQVSAGRVREIAPASMSKEEGSQFMK